MSKRILITEKNSYIGESFKNWLAQSEGSYEVESVGTKNNEWEKFDFSNYDAVLHVAGIAHVKETKRNRLLYYQINRDLAYDIAKKAKESDVKQFIFLSSMSVYGLSSGAITKDTIPSPKSAYGKSKLEVEELISRLESTNFIVAIIRPPMVYGKGSKGNYALLSKFAKITPIFFDFNNKRSMIYIDNLSEFIKTLVDSNKKGLYTPQNREYVCTSTMIQMIGRVHENYIRKISIFNPLIKLLIRVPIISKILGDLYYYPIEYPKTDFSFEESILRTEEDVLGQNEQKEDSEAHHYLWCR